MADISLIGKWQWYSRLSEYTESYIFNLTFTSNEKEYVKINYDPTEGLIYTDSNGSTYVAYAILDGQGTWTSENDRIINVTGGDDVSSSVALNNLLGMATKISEVAGKEITIKNPMMIVNRVEEISGVPIEISSLDSALLVAENEGKVYKYDGKLYRIVGDENFNDLEGLIITVPSGWTAIAGYGKFHLAGTISFSGGTIRTFDTSYTSGNFLIGYDNVSDTTKNKIIYRFTPDTAAFITNNTEFILKPTGGNDIAKPSLIQWLKGVGATFENTGYIFQEILSPSGTLEITANGEVDVKEYEKVNVNVASSGGTIEGMNTVNFLVDGSVYAVQAVSEGKTVLAPTPPTKDNYSFYGWSEDGGSTKLSFPYTPTSESVDLTAMFVEGQSASVSGLGSSSPTSQIYTRDDNFPTSFEEVTDDLGNVFIKIPTMYRKEDTVVSNQLTKFTISTSKNDDTYIPYSVFVKPDGSIMDYVLIGKYQYHNETSAASVADGIRATLTIGNARIAAQSLGSGYQIYDWQFQKLFVDLALVISQKVNFNSGASISSYLGLEDFANGWWIDGVSRNEATWCIAYDPSKYVDSATSSSDGYTAVSYTAPTTNSVEIKKLGYDTANPFFNYPNETVSNTSYNTYYCDGYWYASGNHPVYSGVGAAGAGGGLWACGSHYAWSGAYGARLCYRPL